MPFTCGLNFFLIFALAAHLGFQLFFAKSCLSELCWLNSGFTLVSLHVLHSSVLQKIKLFIYILLYLPVSRTLLSSWSPSSIFNDASLQESINLFYFNSYFLRLHIISFCILDSINLIDSQKSNSVRDNYIHNNTANILNKSDESTGKQNLNE